MDATNGHKKQSEFEKKPGKCRVFSFTRDLRLSSKDRTQLGA